MNNFVTLKRNQSKLDESQDADLLEAFEDQDNLINAISGRTSSIYRKRSHSNPDDEEYRGSEFTPNILSIQNEEDAGFGAQ